MSSAAASSSSSSFDPTSSSTRTASLLALCGLACACMAAYNMGRTRNDRNSSVFQLSWWSVPSAICAFIIALVIMFTYD